MREHGQPSILAEIAECPGGSGDRDFVVILQAADARKIGLDPDAEPRQFLGWTQSGQHQNRRARVGPRREDDFGVGVGGPGAARTREVDPDGLSVLDPDSHRRGAGFDGQARIGEHRPQERIDSAAPSAGGRVDGVLHETGAGLR